MEFTTLNAEPDGDEVRVETHRGRKHLVAPVVMVREGVLNGGFLPFDAIAESIPGWNGRPVTAPPDMNSSGHPVDEDGNFVSANEASYLESMRVGFIQAPEATDDLPAANDEDSSMSRNGARAEVWVDLQAAAEVGEAAVAAVEAMAEGEPLEVSTGYFHKRVDRGGSFNGERYDHEQFGLMPDHLALLPNEKGACSWGDGCGAPRVNELMQGTTNQEEGDRVRWEGSDGDVRYGIIVEDQETENEEVIVAVYAWDGEEWVRGDDTVNLQEDTYEVIEQFPSEPAEEPVDNVAALADADTASLSERAAHAVHILTGNSSGCSCGGHADGGTDADTETTTDMNHDYEALAEELGVAAETLESMSDDEVEALASNVDDGDNGDDDGTPEGAQNTDDGEQDDEVSALREQVESLTETVEELNEAQNADPEAEEAREFLAENTERDLEALAEWPDEAVVETASAHGFNAGGYAAPRGNRVNRLGQAGGPSTHESEEDASEYVSKAGALNNLAANEEGE